MYERERIIFIVSTTEYDSHSSISRCCFKKFKKKLLLSRAAYLRTVYTTIKLNILVRNKDRALGWLVRNKDRALGWSRATLTPRKLTTVINCTSCWRYDFFRSEEWYRWKVTHAYAMLFSHCGVLVINFLELILLVSNYSIAFFSILFIHICTLALRLSNK